MNILETFGNIITQMTKVYYFHFYSTCKVLVSTVKQEEKKIDAQDYHYLQMFWLFAYKT